MRLAARRFQLRRPQPAASALALPSVPSSPPVPAPPLLPLAFWGPAPPVLTAGRGTPAAAARAPADVQYAND